EPKVIQVLVCLAEEHGNVVGKQKLMEKVWPETFVTDDVLTRSISELRDAFGDDARDPRIIQTIPKQGYRLLLPTMPTAGAVKRARVRRVMWASFAVVLLAVASWLAVSIMPRSHTEGAAAPKVTSLAVLPLKNLSGDPTQDYFADGMTEAV